jgi:hypothetical protein
VLKLPTTCSVTLQPGKLLHCCLLLAGTGLAASLPALVPEPLAIKLDCSARSQQRRLRLRISVTCRFMPRPPRIALSTLIQLAAHLTAAAAQSVSDHDYCLRADSSALTPCSG